MTNFLCITALVVISFYAHASVKKVPGTIISKGQSNDVMFEIKPAFLLPGEPDFEPLQYKIKYYDENGKKHILRPEDADEIRFKFDGGENRMISCSNTLGLGTVFSVPKKIFLKLEIEGPLRLYRFYFKKTNAPVYGGITPVTATTNMGDHFIFQKGSGQLKQPKVVGWKKDMLEYFSDCPAVRDRIENKNLGKEAMAAIAVHYNEECGKK